jgi:hypothetical protein
MEKSTKIVSNNWHKSAELSHFLNRMSSGFALQEIILNESGEPSDVRFLAVNKAFEKMWGMKAGQIVGKTGKQIKANFNKPLLHTFAKVTLTGKTARTEYFRQDLQTVICAGSIQPRKRFICHNHKRYYRAERGGRIPTRFGDPLSPPL